MALVDLKEIDAKFEIIRGNIKTKYGVILTRQQNVLKLQMVKDTELTLDALEDIVKSFKQCEKLDGLKKAYDDFVKV